MSRQLILVDNGVPLFCVYAYPAQDSESFFSAISVLVTHIQACLNQPILWWDRQNPPDVSVVLTLKYDIDAELEDQEFEVITTEKEIILRAGTINAMNYAVCAFLEETFNIRWLWPGKTGTYAPKAESITRSIGTCKYKPDFLWRRLWLGGAFWNEQDPMLAEMKYGKVSCETLELLKKWQELQRLDGLNIADGHRWSQICSPLEYGQSHSEYFALVDGERQNRYYDGKHRNQPCSSNPNVIELTTKYICEKFRHDPTLNGFSLAVNDGGGFCECSHCKAIDDWAGINIQESNEFTKATSEIKTELDVNGPGCNAITDRMFKFVNNVAAKVHEKYPDKFLLTLIYGPYRAAPRKVRLAKNVVAQFCSMTWAHTLPEIEQKELALLKGLKDFAVHIGIYDYFINGSNGTMPRGFAKTFVKSLKKYHQFGCRYFSTQASLDFALGGFNYYLAARLLWDINQSLEDILAHYCEAFEDSKDTIRAYLKAFMDRWEHINAEFPLNTWPMETQAAKLYPPDWLESRKREIDIALKQSNKKPSVVGRIEFLEKGLDFLILLSDVCTKILRLIDNGAPMDIDSLKKYLEMCDNSEILKQTVEARNNLLKWVNENRDGFFISAMWFEYQIIQRGGLLGKWCDLIERYS